MSSSTTQDTAERSAPVYLLILAGPIIASMVSRTVMSWVDFIMVSQLGTEAQAAILPAGVTLFCVIAFGMGVLTAVNTFVAQAYGRETYIEATRYAWQGIYLALAMGVAALVLIPGVHPFFDMVGHEEGVTAMEVDYAEVGLVGVGATLLGVALSQFFTGIHRPMVTFIASVVGNVFNVVGNYALIFGNWGFEPMGVRGAAWATAGGAALQAAIMLAWLMHPYYGRVYAFWQQWSLRPSYMLRMLGVGVPAGVQFSVDIISWTIFSVFIVGQFGTEQLAAHNISFKFLELSFMPGVGLGMAVAAAVGKAIGQGRREKVGVYVRWGLLFNILYMGLVGVGMGVGGEELVALLSDDSEVIRWGGRLLILCALFQIFDAMGIIMISTLRGAGDTRWPALAFAVLATVILLGGGMVISRVLPQWGSCGPWVAATLYIMVLATIMACRYRWGPWREIELLDATEPEAMTGVQAAAD